VISEVCNVARTIQSLFTDHLMHTAHKKQQELTAIVRSIVK